MDEKTILATIKRLTEAARNPPGFNHPAYPKGDPRALLIIETATEVASRFHYYQRSLHVDARFGGRRVYDPPSDMDPAHYEHPNRGRLRAYDDRIEDRT